MNRISLTPLGDHVLAWRKENRPGRIDRTASCSEIVDESSFNVEIGLFIVIPPSKASWDLIVNSNNQHCYSGPLLLLATQAMPGAAC